MSFQNINIRNIQREALTRGGIIVDVRERDKFIEGHIPMAINLPLEDIQNNKITLPKNKVIIVYCETGGSSALAAKLLSDTGYHVLNAVGGIRAYRGALSKTRL